MNNATEALFLSARITCHKGLDSVRSGSDKRNPYKFEKSDEQFVPVGIRSKVVNSGSVINNSSSKVQTII